MKEGTMNARKEEKQRKNEGEMTYGEGHVWREI